MIPEDAAQGGVEEVRAGVVARGVEAHGFGDGQRHFLIREQGAAVDFDVMHGEIDGGLQGIKHLGRACGRGKEARITALAAGRAVEGCAVGHGIAFLPGDESLHGQAVLIEQGGEAARAGKGVVTEKFALEAVFEQGLEARGHILFAGTLPRGAGALLLLAHIVVETRLVSLEAALFRHVVDDVEREAVGVVEPESGFAGNDRLALGGEGVHFLFKHGKALVERGREAFLLLAHDARHEVGAGAQFRVALAHDLHHLEGGLVEEGVLHPHEAAKAEGAADEAAQHVAPAFVGGEDAVRDHEGDGPAVIRNDAQGGVRVVAVVVAYSGEFGHVLDEGLEEVGIVVGAHALTDRRNALKAHAGVDGGMGQGNARAVRLLVELHEHEVPDFKETVAITGADAAVRAAGHVRALIIVDFRTRPAGAGIAHAPEVVLVPEAENAFRGHARHLLPQFEGFVVVLVDGDVELFLGQLQLFGDEGPREANGVFLEIVTEGEVPEHLEEGMVARRAAHVVEVVVLAAHAQALLGGGGAFVIAFFLSAEDLLELDHARVGEQEGRIVAGDERRRGDFGVSVFLEIVQKAAADFIGCQHRGSCVGEMEKREAFFHILACEKRKAPERGAPQAAGVFFRGAWT